MRPAGDSGFREEARDRRQALRVIRRRALRPIALGHVSIAVQFRRYVRANDETAMTVIERTADGPPKLADPLSTPRGTASALRVLAKR